MSKRSSLQVTPDQLMTALTTRAIETMGERIVKNLDAAAASVSRDALAKNLYAKLFDWLVAAINRKISAIGKPSGEPDTASELLSGGWRDSPGLIILHHPTADLGWLPQPVRLGHCTALPWL